jgi:hypothetical protein
MDTSRSAAPLITLAPADVAVIVLFLGAVLAIGFRASRHGESAAPSRFRCS